MDWKYLKTLALLALVSVVIELIFRDGNIVRNLGFLIGASVYYVLSQKLDNVTQNERE